MHHTKIYAKEAAELLDRSHHTLRRWKAEGKGPRAYSDGYRTFYIREEIENWITAQMQ